MLPSETFLATSCWKCVACEQGKFHSWATCCLQHYMYFCCWTFQHTLGNMFPKIDHQESDSCCSGSAITYTQEQNYWRSCTAWPCSVNMYTQEQDCLGSWLAWVCSVKQLSSNCCHQLQEERSSNVCLSLLCSSAPFMAVFMLVLNI